MVLRRLAVLLFLVFAFSSCLYGQKADLAFSAGATFASDAHEVENLVCFSAPCPTPLTISTRHQVFFETTGAFRLANFKVASLHLELPVGFMPAAGFVNFIGLHISSLFVTPSLRLKFLPGSAVSPFLSAGGGFAHYHVTDETSDRGALQFGGGFDFKAGIPLLGFRVEARDFVTGQPNFGIIESTFVQNQKDTGRRHNVFAGGGVVLRF